MASNKVMQFINTTHPDDATSTASIRTIRAHVARTGHAKARQNRMLSLDIRPWKGPPEKSAAATADDAGEGGGGGCGGGAAGRGNKGERTPHSESSDAPARSKVPASNADGGAVKAAVAAESLQPRRRDALATRRQRGRRHVLRQEAAASSTAASSAADDGSHLLGSWLGLDLTRLSPSTVLGNGRWNPFEQHVRQLSEMERWLVDHCEPSSSCLLIFHKSEARWECLMSLFTDMTYVVDNGYTECDHGPKQALFLNQVRSCWVPWSMAHEGLLAGLLMTACRSLVTIHRNQIYGQPVSVEDAECNWLLNDYEANSITGRSATEDERSQDGIASFNSSAAPETDDGPYGLLLIKYKIACLRTARAAIANEDKSDATIALALVLAAEEVSSLDDR